MVQDSDDKSIMRTAKILFDANRNFATFNVIKNKDAAFTFTHHVRVWASLDMCKSTYFRIHNKL